MSCSTASSFSDIPAYTKFHIAIGFTAIAFASIAFATKVLTTIPCVERRIPARILAIARIIHPIAGGAYIVCAIFMPITANWIWPRLGTPTAVIGFIATMFVSLVLGVIAIRVYAKMNEVGPKATPGNQTSDAVHAISLNLIEPSESTVTSQPRQRRCGWLRLAHALLMCLSWYMIIGAGSAFTSNARLGAFPYGQSDPMTDSLIGRCFARNLTDPLAPAWLSGLQCGLGAYCSESSQGAGSNSYCRGTTQAD